MSPRRRRPHPPARTLARTGVVVTAVAVLTGCGPDVAEVRTDPVDYLGVFAAQADAVRTLAGTDPALVDAQAANRSLGWDTAHAPYTTVAVSRDTSGWTLCTRENATSRHVSRTETTGQVTYRFSPHGCPTSAKDADAVLVLPAGGDPDVVKGAAKLTTVVEQLDAVDARAAAADTVDALAADLADALDAAAAAADRYPGVGPDELPDTVGVDLPDGVGVARYLPAGATAEVCVVDVATGAYTVYTVATNRDPVRERGGATGATC